MSGRATSNIVRQSNNKGIKWFRVTHKQVTWGNIYNDSVVCYKTGGAVCYKTGIKACYKTAVQFVVKYGSVVCYKTRGTVCSKRMVV